MYFHFASVLVFFALGAGLVALMLGLSSLLRPRNPETLKLSTYECGEPPTGNAWINFNIRFYMIALVFIIFDVEAAFLWPVVTVYKDWVTKGQGAFALLEIAIFLLVLFVGLVYVWVKKDLEWQKQVPAAEADAAALREAA